MINETQPVSDSAVTGTRQTFRQRKDYLPQNHCLMLQVMVTDAKVELKDLSKVSDFVPLGINYLMNQCLEAEPLTLVIVGVKKRVRVGEIKIRKFNTVNKTDSLELCLFLEIP